MHPRTLRRFAFAFVAVLTLVGTGCGGGGAEQETALVANDKNTAPPPATGPQLSDQQSVPPSDQERSLDLPAIDVINVVSGEQRSLASLVPSDRPLLLWFWAPH